MQINKVPLWEFEQSCVCGVSMDLATILAAKNANTSHRSFLISMQKDSNSFKSPMLPIEFYPPRGEKIFETILKFVEIYDPCPVFINL